MRTDEKCFTVRREFLIRNNPLYSDVQLSDVDLPINDVPEQVLSVLDLHTDRYNEDAISKSTYTPQTDINDVTSDNILMNSSGLIDMEGLQSILCKVQCMFLMVLFL